MEILTCHCEVKESNEMYIRRNINPRSSVLSFRSELLLATEKIATPLCFIHHKIKILYVRDCLVL